MAKPVITICEAGEYRLVKFEIPGGVTSPAEFAAAIAEMASAIPGDRPVLLNGRGPVWGYGMLLHAGHPTPAMATYDPRLGYVVVATHDESFVVGQVIPDPEAS